MAKYLKDNDLKWKECISANHLTFLVEKAQVFTNYINDVSKRPSEPWQCGLGVIILIIYTWLFLMLQIQNLVQNGSQTAFKD